MENKFISIDFYSEFGFLKKPDINEDIYLTYNCLHKPALLGILGSIVGMNGYSQAYEKNKNSLPEYFEELNSLKVGIKPLNSRNGNFPKTVIVYNNSVGYASKETGGNLIVKEQTLIKPSYRIFLLLNLKNFYEKELYNNLKDYSSVYVPYLGKNDFQLNWNNFQEYQAVDFNFKKDFTISSIFKKEKAIKEIKGKLNDIIDPAKPMNFNFFSYFERLPVGFDEVTKNYELWEFAFTNFEFPSSYILVGLYELTNSANNTIVIQLF